MSTLVAEGQPTQIPWQQFAVVAFLVGVCLLGLGLAFVAESLQRADLVFVSVLLSAIGVLLAGLTAGPRGVSVTTLFCAFFMLYGVSGPMEVILGRDLPSLFGPVELSPSYGISFALASLGLMAGIIWSQGAIGARRLRDRPPSEFQLSPTVCIWLGMGLSAISSVLEIINFIRVGGITAIGLGKALYQSRIAGLVLTGPTYDVLLLGAAFLAAAWLQQRRLGGVDARRAMMHLSVFVLLGLGAILPAVLLGRRGPLLGALLILSVGWFQSREHPRLNMSFVGIMLLAYVGMGLIYANRAALAYSAGTGDWTVLEERVRDREALLDALNPGANEFGAAFGNASVYLQGPDRELLWGQSYLEGALLLVPGFLYPGEKPPQLTYRFRDLYFPSEAMRGSVAGTGFSALVESLMNFGYTGPLVVYAFVGLFLVVVDWVILKSQSTMLVVAALLGIPSIQSFHRSALGTEAAGWVLSLVFLATILTTVLVAQVVVRRGPSA